MVSYPVPKASRLDKQVKYVTFDDLEVGMEARRVLARRAEAKFPFIVNSRADNEGAWLASFAIAALPSSALGGGRCPQS